MKYRVKPGLKFGQENRIFITLYNEKIFQSFNEQKQANAISEMAPAVAACPSTVSGQWPSTDLERRVVVSLWVVCRHWQGSAHLILLDVAKSQPKQ